MDAILDRFKHSPTATRDSETLLKRLKDSCLGHASDDWRQRTEGRFLLEQSYNECVSISQIMENYQLVPAARKVCPMFSTFTLAHVLNYNDRSSRQTGSYSLEFCCRIIQVGQH